MGKINMNNKGFTLIELMTVVVIISLLASFGFVTLSSKELKLKRATRRLSGDFQTLKMEAVKRNGTAVIIIDANNETYTMFMDDGSAGNNWALDVDDTSLGDGVITISDPVEIVSSSLPSNTFGYSSTGLTAFYPLLPPTPPATDYEVRMRLKDNDGDSTNDHLSVVRLSIVGSPHIERSTDGGTTWRQ